MTKARGSLKGSPWENKQRRPFPVPRFTEPEGKNIQRGKAPENVYLESPSDPVISQKKGVMNPFIAWGHGESRYTWIQAGRDSEKQGSM